MPIGSKEVRFLSVLCYNHKLVDLDERMKAAHEQQLQTSKMLEERAAEDEAFRRLVLKPEVIALASTFIARVISGKPRSGSTCSSGMKGFIKENSQLVGDLAKAAKLDCSPEEFAEFADKNYTLNGQQGKSMSLTAPSVARA